MPPYTYIAYFALWMTETAVPHEGNVRIGHVVVTPVCTIFVFTAYITLITATSRWNRAIS
jgi:hypothetical protein